MTRHAHQTAVCLRDEIQACRVAHRPELTEARDRAVDEVRALDSAVVVAEPKPGHRTGTEVLDEDVGRVR